MAESLIGLGTCSKFYLYILGYIFFNSIKDCLFGFTAIDPENKIDLFGFQPELSRHFLFQDFYRYLSYILGGLIFMHILKKKSNEEGMLKKKSSKSLKLKNSKGLIQDKKDDIFKKIPRFKIIKVCFFYCFHVELNRIMYLFDFNGLDFWIFDIIFTLFFMDTYFIIKYHRHQKCSIIFILIVDSILLIISSFLKNTNNGSSDLKDKNTYEIINDLTGNDYFFLLVLLIFIFLSAILAYSKVSMKVLMQLKYISPFRIIYDIGIIGIIISLIGLIFVSIFDCKGGENIKNYCIVNNTEYSNDNNTKYYYDNIEIYFKNLFGHISDFKFYLEIFLITPLYLITSFCGFFCELLIIYYLNPLYVLVRGNLYYCIQKFIFILINLDNYQNYISTEQLFILQSSEIIALLGYSVYLEIIELRFCGLDKDLKRKIIERGERETIHKSIENNIDENNNDFDESFIDENNNNNEEKKEELEIV